MLKPCKALFLTAVIVFIAAVCSSCTPKSFSQDKVYEYTYSETDQVLYNPLMGFVPEGDYEDIVGDNTLVYINILWSEAEPEEGAYDFDAIAEKNNIERWKSEGKHAMIRVMCDKPSSEKHMDIPEWLYDKTGDGVFYNYDGKMGYSPDYNNNILIEAHAKLIYKLGEYFGDDGFVAFVELGSLGHYGEWHVAYDEGILRIPSADIREYYITPYIDAFPDAEILMRRPFNTAKDHGFGLYNDMAGHPESTADWLDWIQNGGDYNQALEKDALSPMPDAWKLSPVGGEFTSSLTYTEMLGDGLERTIKLLRDSHTTFLGPNFPTATREETGKGYEDSISEILKNIGYRFHVSKAGISPSSHTGMSFVEFTLTNLGCAPIYRDFPVCIFLLDSNDSIQQEYEIDYKLSSLLPEESVTLKTEISGVEGMKICLGIKDPMTGTAAVSFATDAPTVGTMLVLADFS